MSVLRAILRSGIRCAFTVQARFEVGFDDEMLGSARPGGLYGACDGRGVPGRRIVCPLPQAEHARPDRRLHPQHPAPRPAGARPVHPRRGTTTSRASATGWRTSAIENDLCGVLIQAMYFVPGTPSTRPTATGSCAKGTGAAARAAPCTTAPHEPGAAPARGPARQRAHLLPPRLLHALRRRRRMYRLLFAGSASGSGACGRI